MHSDPSKLSALPPGVPQDVAPEGTDLVLARRRLLLRGLGKGAAAAAALSPLASQATRSYTIPNGALNGGLGYCSISGFQSAAISFAPGGNAPTPCSAPGPTAYFKTDPKNYTHGATTAERRQAIRDLLTSWGVAPLPGNVVLDSLSTSGGQPWLRDGKIYKNTLAGTSGGSVLQIYADQPGAYPPGTSWSPVSSFDGMLNESATTVTRAVNSLLHILYSHATDDRAYVIAVFLGCIGEDGARTSSSGFTSGTIPFDAKYVADQYNNPATRANAVAFFKRICGA